MLLRNRRKLRLCQFLIAFFVRLIIFSINVSLRCAINWRSLCSCLRFNGKKPATNKQTFEQSNECSILRNFLSFRWLLAVRWLPSTLRLQACLRICIVMIARQVAWATRANRAQSAPRKKLSLAQQSAHNASPAQTPCKAAQRVRYDWLSFLVAHSSSASTPN